MGYTSCVDMTALELPLSLDAARCMKLEDFLTAVDDDGCAETVGAVVEALAAQRVLTVKRLASSKVCLGGLCVR